MATMIVDAASAGEATFPTSVAEAFSVKPKIDSEGLEVRVTGFIKADHRTVDLTEADTIVAIGRGVGAKENLGPIEAFADRIGAAIGGTRPMVDARILPYERQIGQTGKRVAPRLIFLLGISGAVEFAKGIEGAGAKLAVNVDADAPIFRLADVTIQGDVNSLVHRAVARLTSNRD